MNKAQALLRELQGLGIRIGVSADNLTLNAPKGVLTAELRERIGLHKQELLAMAREGGEELQRISRSADMPLTRAQQRLWFMRQLAPTSGTYNVARAFWWNGDLDIASLQGALRRVVMRHESLRTRFFETEGMPRCAVDDADASGRLKVGHEVLPEGASDEEALTRVTQWASEPMDLSVAPLLRAKVYAVRPGRSLVCVVVDHIVSDGLSIVILVRELAQFYAAERGAVAADLPELSFQYLDFADWQQRRVAHGKLESEESYWREQLRDLPALLELPTDRPRPVTRTGAGAQFATWIESTTVERLKAFARSEEVTPFMLLLAVLQTLLSRHANTEDVTVGSVIATRDRAEAVPVIGLFTNNLVLRGNLGGEPSLRELLRRTRKVATEAYAHQQMPFDLLVELLAPQRQLAASPLFQVLLVLHGEMQTRLRLDGAELVAAELSLPTARYDLAFDLFEVDGRYRVYCEYSTELFDAATVEFLLRRFDHLLGAAMVSPEVPVARLPLLDERELRQVLVDFNATAAAVPDQRFIERFEEQVATRPDSIALSAGDERLTYAQVDVAVRRLACQLRDRGAGPGRLVGVHLERTLALPIALLAIHRTGAAHVPLDPAFPADRLVYMLEDAGARLIVVGEG
ncbi:MAG: condensation domain-containing protein, partial [Steroidobacteraceae bacterium]